MNILLKMKIIRKDPYKNRIERQVLKDINNCINLSDSYLLQNFGINRIVFHQVLRILEPVVQKPQRTNGIPFPLKVLLTLSFLRTGFHQKLVGKDFDINISQKSVSRIIKSIIEGFNAALDTLITFPTSILKRKQIKEGFYRQYHFPDTIGCIDGTYVEIVCPRYDEEAFYDRKGLFSINAQIVCDSDHKIIAICCRFGGAANNAYIWNKMIIKPFIKNINRQGESSWFLGNNNYPQRAWLMTPILHARHGTLESHYNYVHRKTKTCIDNCIAILKGRWRCLYKKPLHYNPQGAAKIINACAALHNICISAGLAESELYIEPEPEASIVFNDLDMQDHNINDLYEGIEMRQQLAERIYYNV